MKTSTGLHEMSTFKTTLLNNKDADGGKKHVHKEIQILLSTEEKILPWV